MRDLGSTVGPRRSAPRSQTTAKGGGRAPVGPNPLRRHGRDRGVRKEESRGRKGKQPDGSGWSSLSCSRPKAAIRRPAARCATGGVSTVPRSRAPPPATRTPSCPSSRSGSTARPAGAASTRPTAGWSTGQHMVDRRRAVPRRRPVDLFHAGCGMWPTPLRNLTGGAGSRTAASGHRRARKAREGRGGQLQPGAWPTRGSGGVDCASGVIESGCKRVICSRLKRGGMHWTVRRHGTAVQHPERALRGLLGTAGRNEPEAILKNLTCTPRCCRT